jgi:signal transduction histidine kinase/CheY-like chemotaxis protein/HPt (histidine-containing phosphotransfer) domain-containing protein
LVSSPQCPVSIDVCRIDCRGHDDLYVSCRRTGIKHAFRRIKQAVALADNLAASTASYIIVKDYTSLESILIRAARFPSIKDIQVSNDAGLLLGDVYRNSSGEVAVRYESKAASPPLEPERHIKIKAGIITVWQPVVLGDLVGWIRTRYTLHRIEAVKAQIWLHNASLGSIVVVVTILLFYLYLRRPFHLIEQSAKFADELDVYAGQQIPVNKNYEELNRLTSALNRTSKNLEEKNEAISEKIREQQRLTDELELRVSERTAELSVARDEAINANRSKSEFLANMSHEIRTPLTAVIGFAESLLDSGQSIEERVDSINRIIQAGNHLLRIINEILDLSKIEANRLEIEYIPFSLVNVFRDIYSLVKLQTMEKGLSFKITYETPVPRQIKSDPVRLKQILINLCNNAIKFTREGSINIKVSSDTVAEILTVKVIDSGIGLTQEQLAKLFRPFSQADASTTRKYGGTGLGLHLSKQLAEKLGGTLIVESVPDVGSCFTLTISTGLLNNVEMLATCPDFEHLDTVQNRQKKQLYLRGRVLLTEDNQDNQRLVSLILKRMGVEYEIANNGKEAIAKAGNEHFDVILMDVQMPIMDGLTATSLLRQQGYTGPIVALTANAMRQEKQDCYDAGCNEVCTKPIDYAAFSKVLSRYLGKAEVSAPGTSQPIVSTLFADEPELADLILEFVKKLPDMIKNIETSYAAEKMEELRQEVHTLKGTGGNFGYAELFELAKRIEFEIVAGNREEIGVLINSLVDVAKRIRQGAALMDNSDNSDNILPNIGQSIK